jgi:uncharacterized membrane protein YkoI
VITAGVALAVVHEMRAAEASSAARTAIDAVGGGWATPSTTTDEGAAWQFRVVYLDGTTEEVALDRDLHVLRVGEIRAAQAPAHTESSYDRTAGEPIAQAQTESPPAPAPAPAPARRSTWTPASTADFERAAQAALSAAGGGTVHDVDRENENGSTWEVELTAADGRYLEIQLDAQFNVLFMGSERDANEGQGDREDEGHDDD